MDNDNAPFWAFISLEDFTERFEGEPSVEEDHILVMWETLKDYEFEDEEQALERCTELQHQVVDYLNCLEQFALNGPRYVGRTHTYFKGYVEAVLSAPDSTAAVKVMVDFLNRARTLH